MNLELVAALGAAVILSACGSGTTDTGPGGNAHELACRSGLTCWVTFM